MGGSGARQELVLGYGRWWELGWDPRIRSFFAELYPPLDPSSDPDYMQPRTRLGTEDEPIRLLSRLEQLVGEPFPPEIRRVLEADRSLRSSWR